MKIIHRAICILKWIVCICVCMAFDLPTIVPIFCTLKKIPGITYLNAKFSSYHFSAQSFSPSEPGENFPND